MRCVDRYEGDAGCDIKFSCWNDPTKCIRRPLTNANSIRKEPSSNRGPDESLKSLGARAAKELRRQVREGQDRVHANLSHIRRGRYYDLQDFIEAFRRGGFPKRTSRQNKPGDVGDSEA